MKPQAVIFSSSESLDIARDFANALNGSVSCTVWKDLPFALSNYTQRDLAAFGKKYDFALLIFGFEDEAIIKANNYNVTRDNVVYELGLMSGLIGADRCFIIECISNSISQAHLPSDIEGITRVKFDTSPDNRENILHNCVKPIISTMNTLGKNKYISEDLISQLSVAGLSAFYTNRNDFRLRKTDNGQSLELLKDYLSIAQKSIKIVVFTFDLSNKYGQINKVFESKLKYSTDFSITISLLNPFEPLYYSSCYKTHYRDNPNGLIKEAIDNIVSLYRFRDSLSTSDRNRFNIKIHNTALFESAVLIDDKENNGRIQIELKPYGINIYDSFAFEIRRTDNNSIFYTKLQDSYDQLLDNATSLDDILVTYNLNIDDM